VERTAITVRSITKRVADLLVPGHWTRYERERRSRQRDLLFRQYLAEFIEQRRLYHPPGRSLGTMLCGMHRRGKMAKTQRRETESA
jgi:hypothetical protein